MPFEANVALRVMCRMLKHSDGLVIAPSGMLIRKSPPGRPGATGMSFEPFDELQDYAGGAWEGGGGVGSFGVPKPHGCSSFCWGSLQLVVFLLVFYKKKGYP